MVKPRKRAAGAGRQPKGPHRGMSESTTVRLTERTRAALNKRSEEKNLSRSQIMEAALREYFQDDAKDLMVWGPPRVHAAALCFAKITRGAEINSGANPFNEAGPSWLDDRFVFETARAGIVQFLDMLSANRVPGGDPVAPDRVMQSAAAAPEKFQAQLSSPEGIAAMIVGGLYNAIEGAQDLPLPAAGERYAKEYRENAKIKSDLGLGKGPKK